MDDQQAKTCAGTFSEDACRATTKPGEHTAGDGGDTLEKWHRGTVVSVDEHVGYIVVGCTYYKFSMASLVDGDDVATDLSDRFRPKDAVDVHIGPSGVTNVTLANPVSNRRRGRQKSKRVPTCQFCSADSTSDQRRRCTCRSNQNGTPSGVRADNIAQQEESKPKQPPKARQRSRSCILDYIPQPLLSKLEAPLPAELSGGCLGRAFEADKQTSRPLPRMYQNPALTGYRRLPEQNQQLRSRQPTERRPRAYPAITDYEYLTPAAVSRLSAEDRTPRITPRSARTPGVASFVPVPPNEHSYTDYGYPQPLSSIPSTTAAASVTGAASVRQQRRLTPFDPYGGVPSVFDNDSFGGSWACGGYSSFSMPLGSQGMFARSMPRTQRGVAASSYLPAAPPPSATLTEPGMRRDPPLRTTQYTTAAQQRSQRLQEMYYGDVPAHFPITPWDFTGDLDFGCEGYSSPYIDQFMRYSASLSALRETLPPSQSRARVGNNAGSARTINPGASVRSGIRTGPITGPSEILNDPTLRYVTIVDRPDERVAPKSSRVSHI